MRSARRLGFALFALRLLAGVAVATPLGAAPGDRLSDDDARHLLARTGFGPTAAEVASYAGLTRAEAVERILSGVRRTAVTTPPATATDTAPLRPPRGDDTPVAERQAFVRQQARETLELRAWWVEEMLVTPSPLTERMTLFWHNHFVSAQPKVRVSRLMYRQNATLREHAVGRFDDLLHAIGRDAAMVIYLDGAQNRRGAPNENFAREVMELFTLGEGRYGERDVREAARAFTGTVVVPETGAVVFRPRQHDGGSKTVLGRTGRFDGDAVLDILLAEPATATHLTTRLWREFVSPDPDPVVVERLAGRFRASDYDIAGLLRDLLTDDAFYAERHRGVLVKSPIELVVGSLRQLGIAPPATLPFAIAAAGMGQALFAPPNVKGWPGGLQWIDATSLLARRQFLDRLVRVDERATAWTTPDAAASVTMRSSEPPPATADGDDRAARAAFRRRMERDAAGVPFDSERWFASLPGATESARAHSAQRLLLPVDPVTGPADDATAPVLVRALLLDPAYQLK